MLAMMLGAGVVQGRLQCESCHVYLECCCKGVVDESFMLAIGYFCPSGKRMGNGKSGPSLYLGSFHVVKELQRQGCHGNEDKISILFSLWSICPWSIYPFRTINEIVRVES